MLFSLVDDIDFPSLFLGAVKIGAVAVPINTYLKPDDYRDYIADSQAVAVIADHTVAPVIAGMHRDLPRLRHVFCARGRVRGLDHRDDTLRGGGHPGRQSRRHGFLALFVRLGWQPEACGAYRQPHLLGDQMVRPRRTRHDPKRRRAVSSEDPGPISPDTVWGQCFRHEPMVIMGVPTLFAGLLRLAERRSDRIAYATPRAICVSASAAAKPCPPPCSTAGNNLRESKSSMVSAPPR